MNDLFRAIFGIPPNDQNGIRTDETYSNDYRDNYPRNTGDDMGGNDDDDDDDDNNHMGMNPPGGFFNFSFFNDPTSVHKQFERLVNEMNRAFGVFGFDGSPSIAFEDESTDFSPCNEVPCQRTQSLRDLYLKQPESQNCPADNNQLNVKFSDPGKCSVLNSDGSVTVTKGFSKFVYIQRVQRPDGSVETIQKVRDHTGKEETTITQSNVNDPLLPPQDNQPTKDDSSGLSIFKKFFSF